MSISLLERIPIEIWEKILYHATFSPLLPFTEDGELTNDLVDNLLLFEDHCRTFEAYRAQTQALVERLRLVCRLWTKLLRPKTNELSLITIRGYFYPSIHGTLLSTRLVYCHRGGCPCRSQECRYDAYEARLGPVNSLWGAKGGEPLHLLWPRLRILTLQTTENLPLQLLELVDGVKALSITVGGGPGYYLDEFPHRASQLTHLDINWRRGWSSWSFTAHALPQLQYLNVNFLITDLRNEEGKSLEGWTLPSLRTLVLGGIIYDIQEEHIHNFVMRHIEGLAALSLVYTNMDWSTDGYNGPARAPDGIWDRVYPNLSTIGVNIQYCGALVEKGWVERGRREDFQVHTMVVKGLSNLYRDDWALFDELVGRLGRMWRVERFVSAEPWERVKDVTLPSLRNLCEVLEKENLVMVDAFRVSLQDAFGHLLDR
ncbi:6678_t:CDS:1 [Acaulospora colombiana]|uniref:6678_t:CDS:1 n=1 Tax=Acaulospora colombiana TaxID=27376 RepID=A0ACA9P3T9_9GLOM|nr:6678_t:CDS:1 [Acaulospora colombiana]